MRLLRIRVVFRDRHMLNKSQKSDGLKRIWFLLNPQRHATISDVVSHLLHRFDLYGSCPNGLIISMDGFVLPPFESTSILKENDMICVGRKASKLLDTVKAIKDEQVSKEDGIIEKQPLALLQNEGFEEEIGGYQSESEKDEDEDEEQPDTLKRNSFPKKRKASKRSRSPKRKRLREILPESSDKRAPEKHSRDTQHDRDLEILSNSGSSDEENREGTLTEPAVPGSPKKASRSSRRKKAKRKWRQEAMKEKEELKKMIPSNNFDRDTGAREGSNINAAPELQQSRTPAEDLNADLRSGRDLNLDSQELLEQDSGAEGDLVPVVVRPGHIRFTPNGKENDVQPDEEAQKESFNWNGITSKRKGQKWGRDLQSSIQWNESLEKRSKEKQPVVQWNESGPSSNFDEDWQSEPRRNQPKFFNRKFSRRTERELPVKDPLNYDKLIPLTDSPKKGDTIAYRLLVLSDTGCPELSSVRVGKISWFKPENNRIMLVLVPEFPFDFKNTDENASLDSPYDVHYQEDGSLETDFYSLVDVRIVNCGDSGLPKVNDFIAEKASTSLVDHSVVEKDAPWNGQQDSLGAISDKVEPASNNTETHIARAIEKDAWEQILETVQAKKAELQGDHSWSAETSKKRSWSYRSLRSSALGPTIALLRQQNEM